MIVDVFILNYNGAHFLPRCLESVLASHVDGISLSIIVADNGSTDNSADIVQRFHGVEWLPLGGNHGFVRGNNKAVRRRLADRTTANLPAPDVLIFLNNDVEVSTDWLACLLDPFNQEDVGIVGAKSLFLDHFVSLTVRCESELEEKKERRASLTTSLAIEGGSHPSLSEPGRVKGLGSTSSHDGVTWLIRNEATLLVPAYIEKPTSLKLRISSPSDISSSRIVLSHNEERLCEQTLVGGETQAVSVELSPRLARPFIQNAGTFVRAGLVVGDRGFLQEDRGQFSTQEDISAVCGVSLAIRRSLFEKLDGFSEDFVSYYEDVDLSLRARLLGYRCIYAPLAILGHVHAGSGIEGSAYFTRSVSESRIMFLSRYASPLHFWGRVWKELVRACQEAALPKTDPRPHTLACRGCLSRAGSIFRNRLLYWAKGYFWRIPELVGRL